MEETKDPRRPAGAAAHAGGAAKRDEEATSSETLSDVEESQSVGQAGTGSAADTGRDSAATPRVPSPDGQFDSGSGGGDAGPM